MGALRRSAVGFVALLALVGLAVGTAPAASAGGPGHGHGHQPPAGEELAVGGDFTATGTLGSECDLFHQVVDGGGEWTVLAASTFNLDFCTPPTPPDGPWSEIYDGTFTITAADGGTLTGPLTGRVAIGGFGPEFPFELTLTVTAGTGRFAGATGSIAMNGAFGRAAFTAHGSVGGTVTLPPPTPASRADCRHGGWRHVVDDHGRPFRSQARCLRWVRLHT
jgi:hypothetical protein